MCGSAAAWCAAHDLQEERDAGLLQAEGFDELPRVRDVGYVVGGHHVGACGGGGEETERRHSSQRADTGWYPLVDYNLESGPVNTNWSELNPVRRPGARVSNAAEYNIRRGMSGYNPAKRSSSSSLSKSSSSSSQSFASFESSSAPKSTRRSCT